MKKISILTLSVLFFIVSNASAAANYYQCEIIQIHELLDNGKMESHKGAYKNLIGENFTINRDTGEMFGVPFTSKSYKSIEVISRGSAVSSYKAIVISHGNHWVNYIYVQELNSSEQKPFWGTENNNLIYSGLCD